MPSRTHVRNSGAHLTGQWLMALTVVERNSYLNPKDCVISCSGKAIARNTEVVSSKDT
jgi:hypothetical protein